MNAYNTNWRQPQPCDAHNVERYPNGNPQAAPPQQRAATGGSNTSSSHLNCPTCGTTFQEPANAGYKSYLSKCHPVNIDRPDSFFSGQELEPKMYKPVIKTIPETELNLSIPSEIKIENVVANRQQEIDLVPHVLQLV
jgi:hypothetical protein